jgi:ribosome recycling factor
VANLTLIDARTIGVQPFEKKMAAAIEKPSATPTWA